LSRVAKNVLCPFYSESRSFTHRFCDNLREGVPLCVVSGLADELDDWDDEFEQANMVMNDAELRAKFPEHFVDVEHCPSVVRSDLYDSVRPEFKKSRCLFGGLCVRPSLTALRDVLLIVLVGRDNFLVFVVDRSRLFL
jgi:hypothetical protein